MKYLKMVFLMALLSFISVNVSAQKPGYTRYVITKSIDSNGNVKASTGGSGYWIKFDGNLLWLDMGFGSQSRYIYDSTQSNGNKLYYRQAYNYGTMSQGSGWVTFRDSYALVSPDQSVINVEGSSNSDTQVLHIQSADDVGDIIE